MSVSLCVYISVPGDLRQINDTIYPGEELLLYCKPLQNYTVQWTMDGGFLSNSTKYQIIDNNTTLIVKNTSLSDSGK